MMSLRDFHALLRRDGAELRVAVGARAGGALVGVSRGGLDAQLIATSAAFTHDEQWWDSFLYPMDADRGQDATEDLFSPGVFTVELGAGETIARACVQVSLVSHGGPGSLVDLAADRAARDRRIAGMIKVCVGSGAHDTAIARLSAAADQFVVRREARAGVPGGSSIIAGYPWFADWGRDTSIALPGLLISTGRLEEAGQVLDGFAGYRRRGIVPNVFDDATGEPEYNTVDASLWFVLAACTYLERSGDRARFDAKLAPACADVIACYRRGTDFAIAMDPIDKLITAGDASTQLTWMDARRDGVVFTPRFGKAVEINALWHAALRAFARAMRGADDALSESLSELAASVGKSLRTNFWDPVNGCMHDCLAPAEVDGRPVWSASKQVRPNQIFAVSLPDSPLSIDQQRGVLACVEAKLLTPMGLRTLDPADPAYRARYEGSLFMRDAAYHNGTAWPWLLGAYAEAVLRVGGFSDESKRKARAALAPIIESMGGSRHAEARGHGGCLGQIAEIFDASDPQRPQGCPAQAWSVAEVLRVLTMMG